MDSDASLEVDGPPLLIPDLNNGPAAPSGSAADASSRLPAIPEPVPEDILKPIGEIDERREKLMQWERVKLHKRTMVFSVPRFEKAYLLSLEPKLRRSLWVPAVAFIAFALVCLLYPAIWIDKWDTSANILFNLCWIVIIALSLFVLLTFHFSIPPSRFLELYIQLWAGFTMTAATLLGTDYSVAFPGANLGVADISVFLDLITIMYFSVYTPLRIRRLFPVAVIVNCLYIGISIGMGVPSYGPDSDVIESPSTDRWFAVSLSLVLVVSSILCLTGKYRLELFQRTNFLRLEVSQRRIDVLERTIVAFDSSNDKATRVTQMQLTHKRLLLMEKLIFRARSTGLSGLNVHNGQLACDLDHALSLVRKSEKSLFVLDFQKEVLMEGMSSHQQQEQQRRMASGETPKSGAESGSRGGGGHAPTASLLYCSALYTPMSSVAAPGSRIGPSRYDTVGGGTPSVTDLPAELRQGAECFVENSAKLLERVGRDFTLDVEGLWGDHVEENRSKPSSVAALYSAVARACLPDDQANRILSIGSEASDGSQCCPVYERFLAEVCSRYLPSVPYHNALHAAQVAHHCATCINSLGVRSALSDLDWASLIIACLCHDVGHFGRTNGFLVKTRHPLALRYNDRSVMENYHAATTFALLKESEDWDISRGLSRSELKRFRSQIVTLILSTDIGTQRKLLDKIEERVQAGAPFSIAQFPEDSRIIRELCICMADSGHVCLAWDMHYKWAIRLSSEFAAESLELARSNRGPPPSSPTFQASSPSSPPAGDQLNFINRCPLALLQAIGRLVDIDTTEFAKNAREWMVKVEYAIDDNLTRWSMLEEEEQKKAPPPKREPRTVVVESGDGRSPRGKRSSSADESPSNDDDDEDDDRRPMVSYRELYGDKSKSQSDEEEDGIPMVSYREAYGGGSQNKRPVTASGFTSSDEPPLLSYSALYGADGRSIEGGQNPRSQLDDSHDDDEPPLMSYTELYDHQRGTSDDSGDVPMLSYGDLYTKSGATIIQSKDSDDASEPPMISYSDLYGKKKSKESGGSKD
ncbi:Calcium/calmodulin-dependent 3',5'-cyclic nucleotide phosphodiesterase 1B [Perkinsus chesapeaki]|uniref:Phosphodiesterase n=1 Tax=Perkinsus chesapeaki TaxID=330153 RepID=A0A7J6MLR7_PERCH|nr:Calcium/calmodulin-dependent 3',5'-cyclic nucleotide phosphodiesterase 1B [Perkinsus chesapeaki]